MFFGTPDYVVPIVEKLNQTFSVVGVVTQPPKPVGRKQIITPSPVSLWAQKNNIRVFDKNPNEHVEELKEFKADVGVLESYGEILSPEVINLFTHGIINVHPSLLPKLRGASPNQAVILSGDKTTGITVIKLDSQMDHGPIIAQEIKDVDPNETFESLREKLFKDSAELLCRVLPEYLAGKVTLKPQDDSKATYTWKTKETKDKAYFDINNPPEPEILNRMIRAFHPWPNAWTKWQDKIVKFYPGKKVQIEGRNIVSLEEFLRGYPDFPIQDIL
jgi:methionyl-tRNA formyltransferase